jgi:hypothetical protein
MACVIKSQSSEVVGREKVFLEGIQFFDPYFIRSFLPDLVAFQLSQTTPSVFVAAATLTLAQTNHSPTHQQLPLLMHKPEKGYKEESQRTMIYKIYTQTQTI